MQVSVGARSSLKVLGRSCRRRCLHQSTARRAITNLQMPAMSPTMTEGGISSWKKQEGQSFSAGDVLLEIETDKATIDVEAQDDGIMGKIITPDGSKNIPVGKIIALLAEEGDDISNLEVPKEEVKPPSKPAEPAPEKEAEEPKSASPPPPSSSSEPASSSHASGHTSYSGPLFPSVQRLLSENNISDASSIKGTGVRGMLTKGDVLTYLGKASGPLGTFKEATKPETPAAQKKEEVKPLDGNAVRRLIVSSMLQASQRARNPITGPLVAADFDSIISDYLPPTTPPNASPAKPIAPFSKGRRSAGYLDGLI